MPNDTQIIGYDGLRELNYGDYPVSSIAQPIKDISIACVENLIDRINHKEYKRKVILPVKFVDGNTTK